MTIPLALIFEDDPKQKIVFERALQLAGFATEAVMDGLQARSRISGTPPALILLDIHLPYISGLEIMELIRADSRWAEIPVIVATADIFHARELEGQVQVLVKPVGVDQLRQIASRLRPADSAKENTES
ncbi:MAG TPA: response regulator [Anaerolineales bacterium]|nr:response regulator [Anaerolineales bacterium]